MIALYERAVGFYATLVNINAYHQPGVEAGKKAATKNPGTPVARAKSPGKCGKAIPSSAAEISTAG